jgi:hypothetical protein
MKKAILVRRAVAPMDSGSSASLLPADPEAEAVLSKIPMGETLAVKLDRSRSNPQNRLYWAIIDHVAPAVGYETPKALHKALKVALGYYDVVRLPSGKALVDTQSTAFDGMSQDEFQAYMDGAIRLICSDPNLLPGTNRDGLVDEVLAMLGEAPMSGVTIPEEDVNESQRRFDAGVPMPVAPTPPSETIPVQDAEPQRRAGAEQSAHIRQPGPAKLGKQ